MTGEVAGKDAVIKVSGAPTAMVGEPTTSIAGNLQYQITAAAKQILDSAAPVSVQLKGTNDAAEAGTTTTNIKMTAHGLVTGDLIVNTTRASAARIVTRLDADNVTVMAVTGQTTADVIETYKTQLPTAYTLTRLNGKVTFPTAVVRVIRITASYLPMSIAAYANNMSVSKACALLETNYFGAQYKSRIKGLMSASGSLNDFDMADTIYTDALTAGSPVVLEITTDPASPPDRFLALLDSHDLKAALESLSEASISWQSKNDWINKGG